MMHDRTPAIGEIVTPVAAPGETEPRLTLSQLQGLLREAAALERAQRPIVIHAATQTAPAPHPGADVRIPTPAAPIATVDEPRNVWPLVFMVSGCTGLAASATAAATGSQYAILAVFVAVAAWGTATYHLVFER
jgi:hypothetical protein